jgi:hypothetical protein
VISQDEYPAPDVLADPQDDLSWNTVRDGNMADYATPDGTVPSQPYDETTDPEFASVKAELEGGTSDAVSD